MNPVVKIITSILSSINNIIDSMSLRTVETIRRGFFFVIFILSIIGIVIGYNMGTKSAKIKSAPLAEYVNDVFKIDINKEKGDGHFSEMLESEIVNETPMNNFSKTAFPTRENLNPELKKEAIESRNKIPEPDIIDKPFKPETPVDEKRNTIPRPDEQHIKPVEKTFSDKSSGSIIFKDDSKSTDKIVDDGNKIRIIEKDKKSVPEPIKKDTGIIIK